MISLLNTKNPTKAQGVKTEKMTPGGKQKKAKSQQQAGMISQNSDRLLGGALKNCIFFTPILG